MVQLFSLILNKLYVVCMDVILNEMGILDLKL